MALGYCLQLGYSVLWYYWKRLHELNGSHDLTKCITLLKPVRTLPMDNSSKEDGADDQNPERQQARTIPLCTVNSRNSQKQRREASTKWM